MDFMIRDEIGPWSYTLGADAAVAQLADAMLSNSIVRKDMWVRIPSAALLSGQ